MLKTLDAFSFEAQPDLDRAAILQVFDCRFVADAANVVFVGGVGTGKTHLSIALGMTPRAELLRPARPSRRGKQPNRANRVGRLHPLWLTRPGQLELPTLRIHRHPPERCEMTKGVAAGRRTRESPRLPDQGAGGFASLSSPRGRGERILPRSTRDGLIRPTAHLTVDKERPKMSTAAANRTTPPAPPPYSAPGDRTQYRPPAAVLAFPVRNSNLALACVANLDLSPSCRITANTIANFAAVHSRPMMFRHIQAGDCAAYPSGTAIRRKRPGRRKACLKTIRNHIAEMVAAGDAGGCVERRRTVRTNTYIFKLPEQPQKAPGIRAVSAKDCTPLSTPDCTSMEPRWEGDQDLDQEQDQEQKNRARPLDADDDDDDDEKAVMPERATTTTTTTKAVMPGTDPRRGPFWIWASKFSAIFRSRPSCSPETSPPARRTPVKAKPVTEAQLEYLAFLADEVGTDRPSPSTLTVRTADRAIQDLKARRALGQERRDCRRQGTDNIRAEIHSKGSAQALGCPRAGLRARETGGGGRPARFCQEETHVLAEQFSSMEHDARSVFRISQTKRSKPHSMDRPSTAAKHDPPHRTTFIEERRTARRKLMSVPSSAATTRSSGNSRGSVGRWVFAEVERDLISGAHPGGALPRGQVLGAEALGPPERAPWGVFTARGPAS